MEWLTTKAALAWLGGGTIATGGAGIAGGEALLALAGPLGWGIAGVTIAASAFTLGHKNKKISEEVFKKANEIKKANSKLNETNAKIYQMIYKTENLLKALTDTITKNQHLKGMNYFNISEKEQYQLGSIVNNTFALSELLNKSV